MIPSPQPRPRGPIRRLLDRLIDLLPTPSGPPAANPLLDDLGQFATEEREARMRIVAGQERRGRGDGWMG